MNASLQRRFLGVIGNADTYRNLAYLLLGLPLGTIWFSVLVTLIATGAGLLVVALLGVPVLLGTWYVVRALANAERVTANALIGTQLPIKAWGPHGRGNPWRRLRTLTADRGRQRELGFLLLRFPVGIATFTTAVTALSVPLVVGYAPFAARFDDTEPFGTWRYSDRLEEVCSSPWAWGLPVLGAVVLIAALHALNALARASAAWITTALSPSE